MYCYRSISGRLSNTAYGICSKAILQNSVLLLDETDLSVSSKTSFEIFRPIPFLKYLVLQKKTRIVGKVTIEWTITDYWNVVRVIRTTPYYVPDASICLFIMHTHFKDKRQQSSVCNKMYQGQFGAPRRRHSRVSI